MPISQEIDHIIRGCVKFQRGSQKEFYTFFYGYAMSVCMRYTSNSDDAREIVNDGFIKVFRELASFKSRYENIEASLKGWIRQIMVYTAIDYFRKNNKYIVYHQGEENLLHINGSDETAIDKMSYKEIIGLIQNLSPMYRAVFNLYVIDGFKHEEIAEHLGISVGASKSNLARARLNIRKMLQPEQLKLYGQGII